MKRKVAVEFLILFLVISAILYLSFFPVRLGRFPGNESVMSEWCGVLFVENLPDPHTAHERAQAQASLHLAVHENGSIGYCYPFILDLVRDENFRPVNPCPELSQQEGFLLPGDEKEVYGFELSFEEVETAPGVPIEGEWCRIVIIKEGIWGAVFSSNRSLVIARRFGDSCIQFYLLQVDDLEKIAKKYNLSKYEVNYIDGNRAYFWDKKNCLVIL
jgi:hypothetical protein